MDLDVFENEMKEKMGAIGIEINSLQVKKFYKYMNLLIEWNEKMNLTAITDPEEIILKHFVDCGVILEEIEDGAKLIDIGTGAGFPGVPLKLLNETIDVTLVDSLNKRINFLDEVINKLELGNIKAIHSRVEDLSIDKNYREKYDIVTSRAVASLNTLLEYMLPFNKLGGKCICMKGSNIEDEVLNSQQALNILGGKVRKIKEKILPNTDIKRNNIIIEKIKGTPQNYPRKAGKPSKDPIT